MTSLIEGWFLVRKKGEDDSLNLTNSRKSYLSIFDSLPSLGPISTEIYIGCELRLYPGPGGGERLEDQVIHAHGRFCINSTGEAPTLQMEVHRFDVMAAGESIPDTLCTSVTLCGRVGPPEEAPDGLDKFFTLEINEYIRDRTQMFNIRCRLNRTSSKRWEKAVVPSQGITVLVSGFLDGDSPQALFVEVETMQFLSTARGAEGAGPSQSSGKSKFGVPNRVKSQGSATSLDSPNSSPQAMKPLSLLPVPTLTTNGDAIAGPSTPTPVKRKRTTRQTAESPANEEGGASVPKKRKTGSKVA